MEEKNDLILQANERPKKRGIWALLSFQHVFAMFGATILVPLLTGLPVSVALFTSGIGTLIYILCTKAKVPVYLGSSFAYIAAIIAAANVVKDGSGNIISVGSYAPALTGLFAVGIVYVIVALIIRFVGKEWLEKLLPPVVVGPMIAIIGLGLSSTAISMAGLQGGNWKEIATAGFAFLVTIIVALKAKGFFKIIPFLAGIVGGYVFGVAVGLVNFQAPLAAAGGLSFLEVLQSPAQWFRIPPFMFLGFFEGNAQFLGTNITFYQLNAAALISIVPLAFVTICEHIGDHKVLGNITKHDYLQDPGLHRTLMGDGIATAVAAIFGGPANTTYGENTGVVAMTKVGSVYVTGLAAILAVILSFFNLFTSLIATIPTAVMGGICIILYGFIASNGLKVLSEAKVDLNNTRNLIIVSSMLVIGLGGATLSFFNGAFAIYGMSLAAVVGVLLHQFLPRESGTSKVVIEKESK
ncbi:MAG: solute carrier family 23 protein [Bacilli bacterium]|jgi:uracil permease